MARQREARVTAWITISVLAFLDSELLLVRGQADQANARAVDGFSSAVVQAGKTVAQAVCTPLSRADTLTLFDATTGQILQSTCQVTDKIQQFFQGVPGELKSAAQILQTDVNNTVGFVQYMENTLMGIVGNVTAQLNALTSIDKKKPIDLKGVFDRLVQTIEDKKTSDPLCIDAQEYEGAKIPTQCVGPVFELLLDGGSCVEDLSSGIITCTQPSVTLTKTPGACNLKYTSPTVVQDRYCAMSTTYGNSTSGTFKHPAEIFNLEKLLTVPNPFNLDLSFYTATASASASPVAKPPPVPIAQAPLPNIAQVPLPNIQIPLPPAKAPAPIVAVAPAPVPVPAPVPAPAPVPMMAPAPAPNMAPAPGPSQAPGPGPAYMPSAMVDMQAPFFAQNAQAAPGVVEGPYMHEAAQKQAEDAALQAAAADETKQAAATSDARNAAADVSTRTGQASIPVRLPPSPFQAPVLAQTPGSAFAPALGSRISQIVNTGTVQQFYG